MESFAGQIPEPTEVEQELDRHKERVVQVNLITRLPEQHKPDEI